MSRLLPDQAVTAIPAAAPQVVLLYFERQLSLETDCRDVHAALQTGKPGFVLLDVRSPESFAAGHVPQAVNLPQRRIVARNLEAYPNETLFVVYCNGPHCNGADKAAVRLAQLGRPVKKMIGGIEGWKDEGFALTMENSERQTTSFEASEVTRSAERIERGDTQ